MPIPMQVLTAGVDWAGFLRHVHEAPARLLLLDYDGTLAPFHEDPARAMPYRGVREVLAAIARRDATRVVIVSGRPAHEVVPLIDMTPAPEIWGAHGWERLHGGQLTIEEPPAETRDLLANTKTAAAGVAALGARIEQKRASVAVHWRGLDYQAQAGVRELLLSQWAPLVQPGVSEILSFDGGLELRALGCNKHSAVKAVLASTSGAAAIAYLGDDLTDEDAYTAVRPRGLGILVRDEVRPTRADVWLRPPEELLEFLRHWC